MNVRRTSYFTRGVRIAVFLCASVRCTGVAQGDEGQILALEHVSTQIALFQRDLESVRYEMGRPVSTCQRLGIQDATCRQVYYQALTMTEKTNRLYFQLTHRRAAPLPSLPGEVTLMDLSGVIDSALITLANIQRELDITNETSLPESARTKDLDDIFGAIIATNRQLNLLLAQPFAPADVFEQVTLAVGYATRLRSRFGGPRIPPEPTFVRGKQPADVYRRLLTCLEHIRNIATLSDLQAIRLDLEGFDIERAAPSDVYDMASIIVAELAYIHSHAKDARLPHKPYPPGQKFPSHVYQRAGILEAQLAEPGQLVAANPSWLKQ